MNVNLKPNQQILPYDQLELVPKQELFGDLRRPQEPSVKSLMEDWSIERQQPQRQSQNGKWLSEMRDSYRGFFFAGEEDAVYRLRTEPAPPKPPQSSQKDQLKAKEAVKRPQKAKKTAPIPSNTRTLPNSSFSAKYGKPVFGNYGQAHTNPVYGGLGYGHHMKTFNSKQGQTLTSPQKSVKFSSGTQKAEAQVIPETNDYQPISDFIPEQSLIQQSQKAQTKPEFPSNQNEPICDECQDIVKNPMLTTYQHMSMKLNPMKEPVIQEPFKYCNDCLVRTTNAGQDSFLRPPHDLGEIPVQELNPRNYKQLPTQWTQRIPAAGKLSYRSPDSYSVMFYDPQYSQNAFIDFLQSFV